MGRQTAVRQQKMKTLSPILDPILNLILNLILNPILNLILNLILNQILSQIPSLPNLTSGRHGKLSRRSELSHTTVRRATQELSIKSIAKLLSSKRSSFNFSKSL